MKRFLSLLAVTAMPIVLQAATLSPEAALRRALGDRAAHSAAIDSRNTQLYHIESVDSQPAIYIFSKGADHGFIAVSADDATTPLLGFNNAGTLPENYDDLPDGMRYWMESLAEQVAYNAANPCKTIVRTQTDKKRIDWRCKTLWNQNSPFNDLCPLYNGQRCVTGCVATAMAQVMKYYEYPDTGIGTHSYVWEKGSNQTLTFDYSATTFDWDNMLNKYDDNATSDQKNAVATLMRACGIGVDMSYTPQESGAFSINMLRTFIENFGYDQGCAYLSRDYYTISEWEDLVYENIRDYGPVLYNGQHDTSGHQFICDGYMDGYFHFNWGWGGISDGFYLLTALDPGQQGIGGSTSGYNFGQNIVAYLKTENTSPTFYQQICMEGDFTIEEESAALGTQISTITTFWNKSYTTLQSPKVGILIIAEDGTETYVNIFDFDSLGSNYGMRERYKAFTLPQNIQEGTYTVVPAWKNEEGEIKRMPVPVNCRRSYKMTVSDGTAYFYETAKASVSISDFKLASELYLGSPFKNTATITNTSESEEYMAELCVVLIDSNNNLVANGASINVVIPAGESIDWEYVSSIKYNSEPSAGTYTMYICKVKDDNSVQMISSGLPVRLYEASTPTITVSDPYADNNQYFWNLKVSANIQCTAGYFAGTLRLVVWEPDNIYSIASFDSNFTALGGNSSSLNGPMKAPASDTLNWTCNIPNGKINTEYTFAIYQGSSKISNYTSATTSLETGIGEFEIELPGITKREYYSTTGVYLGETLPESGIFIVRETQADGKIRTFKATR